VLSRAGLGLIGVLFGWADTTSAATPKRCGVAIVVALTSTAIRNGAATTERVGRGDADTSVAVVGRRDADDRI
jgi:hypothetical protein